MARKKGQQEGLVAQQDGGVADFSLCATLIIDPQGVILSCSSQTSSLFGCEPQALVGRSFSLLYPLEDLAELCARPDPVPRRYRGAVRKEGGTFQGELLVTPLLDATARSLGFSVVVAPISGGKVGDPGKNEYLMLERLFENSPDAVVVVDRNGMIRKVNRQAEALFGYPRANFIGRQLDILIPPRFRRRHRHHLESYFADPRPRYMGSGLELFGSRRDGDEFPVDIMLSPIETEEGVWTLAVIRDITQRKLNEAKILDLNLELQKQVEQLALANRELESFSYSVSHDLRAPVRHIGGYLQLLGKRDLSCLDPTSRRYLEVVLKATQDMGMLIDDLLAFSRMGRAEMMTITVDMNRLVRDVVEDLEEETKGRVIRWLIGDLPKVAGDPGMLRLVLTNLISNAVKFTRGRPEAVIEIGAVAAEGETTFFVRDNGVGFDMRYVGKIFGLFQRLHKQDEFEGTGVGLANVQRIVARHGGRTWAEATVGVGATFWFSLPASKGAAAQRPKFC